MIAELSRKLEDTNDVIREESEFEETSVVTDSCLEEEDEEEHDDDDDGELPVIRTGQYFILETYLNVLQNSSICNWALSSTREKSTNWLKVVKWNRQMNGHGCYIGNTFIKTQNDFFLAEQNFINVFCSLTLGKGGIAWTTTDKASLAFERALPDDRDDDEDREREERSSEEGSCYSESKSYQQQQLVDQV